MDNQTLINSLVDRLIQEEGVRTKPYRDIVGKLTIGVGRNLDDKGISLSEAKVLLVNDIAESLQSAASFIWFEGLSDSRKIVIVDMIFNMGKEGFNTFTHFQSSLAQGDYQTAADQMLQSKWATQVGQRAQKLAQLMREG